MRLFLFAAAAIAAFVQPVSARTAPQDGGSTTVVTPAPAFKSRADGLIAILKSEGDYDSYFSAAFRAQVPKEKFETINTQLRSQFGQPKTVESIAPVNPYAATLKVGYENGIVTMKLVVDPNAPHPVTGLLITGTEARNDSMSKLESDFRAVPGQAGFGIYALGDRISPVAQFNGSTAAPLGSAFKLWVLAELSRQIATGKRHWSDVVPVTDHRSLPTGIVRTWPKGAPMTLQSLATLMISISDNTATDTLIETLGRAKVEKMVATTGTANPDLNRPFLTTREAFALKTMTSDPLVANWATDDVSARVRGFETVKSRLDAAPISVGMFKGKPLALQIEWFGSPEDMARALNWLRLNGDANTHAILTVNPGTNMKDKFAYLGFKGGSEPGVITLNYLVRTKSGKWFAVTGNWHRDDAEIETMRFTGLMNRALALVPKD